MEKIDLKKKPKPLPEPNKATYGLIWKVSIIQLQAKIRVSFGVSFRDEEGNIFDQWRNKL